MVIPTHLRNAVMRVPDRLDPCHAAIVTMYPLPSMHEVAGEPRVSGSRHTYRDMQGGGSKHGTQCRRGNRDGFSTDAGPSLERAPSRGDGLLRRRRTSLPLTRIGRVASSPLASS